MAPATCVRSRVAGGFRVRQHSWRPSQTFLHHNLFSISPALERKQGLDPFGPPPKGFKTEKPSKPESPDPKTPKSRPQTPTPAKKTSPNPKPSRPQSPNPKAQTPKAHSLKPRPQTNQNPDSKAQAPNRRAQPQSRSGSAIRFGKQGFYTSAKNLSPAQKTTRQNQRSCVVA